VVEGGSLLPPLPNTYSDLYAIFCALEASLSTLLRRGRVNVPFHECEAAVAHSLRRKLTIQHLAQLLYVDPDALHVQFVPSRRRPRPRRRAPAAAFAASSNASPGEPLPPTNGGDMAGEYVISLPRPAAAVATTGEEREEGRAEAEADSSATKSPKKNAKGKDEVVGRGSGGGAQGGRGQQQQAIITVSNQLSNRDMLYRYPSFLPPSLSFLQTLLPQPYTSPTSSSLFLSLSLSHTHT